MISALVSCCNTQIHHFPLIRSANLLIRSVNRQIEFLWKTVQYPAEPRVAAPRREVRAGLTIRGSHAFPHTRTQNFPSKSARFFSQKVDDLFFSRQRYV